MRVYRTGPEHFNFKHGLRNTTEYEIWSSMKKRCYNAKAINYGRYGGRGITVCERWRDSFLAFREDMGPRPSKSHTLDRTDNDGPYCPENCVWRTYQEQMRNKRPDPRQWLITYNGETMAAKQWAKRIGISPVALCWRLRHGWDPIKAVTTSRSDYAHVFHRKDT